MKTLKDLDWHSRKNYEDEAILTSVLKQEAIKWIKEIRKKSKAHWKELDEKHYTGMDEPYSWELNELTFNDWHEAADPSAVISFIKHFFNITEDDLK